MDGFPWAERWKSTRSTNPPGQRTLHKQRNQREQRNPK
jgi:hypothetical protein